MAKVATNSQIFLQTARLPGLSRRCTRIVMSKSLLENACKQLDNELYIWLFSLEISYFTTCFSIDHHFWDTLNNPNLIRHWWDRWDRYHNYNWQCCLQNVTSRTSTHTINWEIVPSPIITRAGYSVWKQHPTFKPSSISVPDGRQVDGSLAKFVRWIVYEMYPAHVGIHFWWDSVVPGKDGGSLVTRN